MYTGGSVKLVMDYSTRLPNSRSQRTGKRRSYSPYVVFRRCSNVDRPRTLVPLAVLLLLRPGFTYPVTTLRTFLNFTGNKLSRRPYLRFISLVHFSQDKTKKVLDIWTKSNTFPSDVLKRLMEQAKVKGACYILHLMLLSISLCPGNHILFYLQKPAR